MKLIIAIMMAAIVYVLSYRIYKKIWDKNLKVQVSFTEEWLNINDSSTLKLVVNNDKLLPLPTLNVKFTTSRYLSFDDAENASVTDGYHRNDAFSIMGNQKITRSLGFTAVKRGFFSVNTINITARDLFLTKTFAKAVKQKNSSIYVFPERISNEGLDVLYNNILGDSEIIRNLLQDPYTFRGIREYQSRDSMRQINWKASARSEELMVNQYGYSSERKIKILLNMDTDNMIRPEYLQEIAIRLASESARYFLDNRQSVAFESNGRDIISGECGRIMPGSSLNHLITINKCLARINEDAGLDYFMDMLSEEIKGHEENTSYVIISPYHKEELFLKLDYLCRMGVNLILIVPHFDITDFAPERGYVRKWEVKLYET